MSPRSRAIFLAVVLAATTAACGSDPRPSPTDLPVTTPSAGPTDGPPSPTSGTSAATGQTDTDWGRIWDALPPGFPRFPGSTPADEVSPDPASARFVVPGGDPGAIATWFQGALEEATFSTIGLNGPGEDGGYVIDSVGEGECQVRTTIAPLGDTTVITILYGSACPAT